ncbi:MAG: 4a-hydroxytetrahydrobiopterin dehydratase [Gammaproteobacteria bacterium]
MPALHRLHCQACRSDSSAVNSAEADELLAQLPGWIIQEQHGVARLVREYRFENFRLAFDFAARIATLAEQEDHHPALQVEWGRVVVHWWTHRISGLHLNDFIMAARTDQAARL